MSIASYLRLLRSPEQDIVALMSREFHDDTRCKGSANAVARLSLHVMVRDRFLKNRSFDDRLQRLHREICLELDRNAFAITVRGGTKVNL
jgi:hypothetical protein